MKPNFKLGKIIGDLKADVKDGLLALAKESGREVDELEVKRANTQSTYKDAFTEGEDAIVQWVSTRHVDRDGDIVVPKGAALSEFQKNPVVLWGHDYTLPPIGSDEWVKVESGGILAKSVYASTPLAQEAFTLRKEGHLRTSSIGFIPLEWTDQGDDNWKRVSSRLMRSWDELKGGMDHVNRVITKWAMLEHSDVPVPANAQALQIAISKGFSIADDLKRVAAKTMDEEELKGLVDDTSSTTFDCSVKQESITLSQETVKEISQLDDCDCGSDCGKCTKSGTPEAEAVEVIGKAPAAPTVEKITRIERVTKCDTVTRIEKAVAAKLDDLDGKV